MKSTETKPSIVFCHGLWADGSCFSKLIGPLQAEGYECFAAQYGLNSTEEDVAERKQPSAGSMARLSWSAIPTAESSSPAPEPTTVSWGWCTSPRSLWTTTKHLKHNNPNFLRRTSSRT